MANYSFNPLQMAIKPLFEKAQEEDPLFAQEVQEKESRAEKPKSLKECADYIMGEAYKYAAGHKSGNFGLAGCPDEQIIAMIKHYYDEDDIKINKVGADVKKAKVTKTEDKKAEGDAEKAEVSPEKKADKTPTLFTETNKSGEKVTKVTRNGETHTMTELTLF